jgi:hypothetical protein
MNTYSLDLRQHEDAPHHDKLQVALIILRSDELEKPLRVSTDNKHRLSVKPLVYGTKSTWQTEREDGGPEDFLYISMLATVPDEPDSGLPTASVTIIDGDGAIRKKLRNARGEVTVDMAVVMADAPNTLLDFWLGMRLSDATGQGSFLTFEIGAYPVLEELYGSVRMTRDRTPALFE